jgi:tRNA-Thr(GGU) m(6)t(6)A37 methyltransferase TsaA
VSGSPTFSFIGVVRSSRTDVVDDDWDVETARIELLPPFDGRALQGLDSFSHCEVVTLLDRATWDQANMVRQPRGNPEWPEVGIFAQRAKDRPNPIGLTVCRILSIDGVALEVEGLDAIDGTPVLDVKPWVAEFGPRGPVHQPAWMTELMGGYW